ncbi:MAG: hypothetical protein O3B03_05545 [Proteobacteria bacterium]|nr:hypothetical protein [Pseudomonadota bacterium]
MRFWCKSLLILVGLIPCQVAVAWSNDVRASGSFKATVAYETQNTYQVHLSPVSNLHWMTTEACELKLLFDDVVVEIYEKNGQRFGAVLRLVTENSAQEDLPTCTVIGLHSEQPN